MKNNKYIYAVTGIIFGFIIGYISSSDNSSENSVEASGIATTTAYSISVADQSAGETVVVGPVSLPKISWVAIRENNNDVVGRILGAQKVFPGNHESITVELLRATAPSVMYSAVFYEDDGDGEFDYKIDSLVEVATGTPVMSRFVAR
jgi:hypothetical protein